MKIAIVTDSCLAMTKEEANDKGIFFFPLQLMCDEESYLDGVNITISQFSKLLKDGKMPTTSCPPVGLVEEGIEDIKAQGYDAIICIPITRGLSATAQNFEAAARSLDIKLHTIDLYTTCNMQYYVTMKVKEMVDLGMAFDEIVSRVEESVESSDTLIIPDDLGHLKRGGRLTPIAATLGSLLKIKPILQLNKKTDGLIDVYDKVRTAHKAYIKAIDDLNKVVQGSDEYIWMIIHSDAQDLAKQVGEMITERTGSSELMIREMPPVISAHTGLNCIGIQYIRKISL